MADYKFKGRYVLVTGASSGIGKEIVQYFVEQGANCICLVGSQWKMDSVLKWTVELEERYKVDVHPILQDLAEDGGPQKVYQRVMEIFPHLDVLVNNAGVITYGDFHQTPLDKHEKLLMVNVRAYLLLMRLFLPDMIARGQGRVLNVASASAFQPTPHVSTYGAGSAFVLALSEAVRLEVRDTGVAICTFCPSHTNTPMIKNRHFPMRLRGYRLTGLAKPARMAKKAIKTLKKGKPVCVPGWRNRLVHLVLPRLTTRGMAARFANKLFKAVEK